MTLGSSVRHLEIATFCITEFSHAFQKLSDVCADWLSLQRRPRQKGHQRSSSVRLRQYCLWPRRRAAERGYQLPPSDGDWQCVPFVRSSLPSERYHGCFVQTYY